MTCGVTPNALWHRCSHVESRRAKCSNSPAVWAESGLGETTTWSAPYANWYANQPDSGGVRGCTPTYVKRSDLQKLDTHEHRRTHCLNLGVKWSQVQILSARPEKQQFTGGFCTLGRPEPTARIAPVGQEWPNGRGVGQRWTGGRQSASSPYSPPARPCPHSRCISGGQPNSALRSVGVGSRPAGGGHRRVRDCRRGLRGA